MIHNATEDELVCSGKIKATDVLIVGTSTTVADLIGEVATLRQEMAAVKQFVGMMPPPASPPPAATPLPQGHQCYHVGVQHYSGSSCHSTHSDGSYAIITVECARNISSEILVNAGCASSSLNPPGNCGFQVTSTKRRGRATVWQVSWLLESLRNSPRSDPDATCSGSMASWRHGDYLLKMQLRLLCTPRL